MTSIQNIQTKLFKRFRSRRRARRVGWLGVDIGTGAIKVAQVERIDDRWRVISRLVIPTGEGSPIDKAQLQDGVLGRLVGRELARPARFEKRRAACLLPMSIVDYRCLQMPSGSETEMLQMVEQQLEDGESSASESLVSDVWSSAVREQEPDGMQEVAVLAVDENVAAAVAQDLGTLGLQCETIDGLPFALARAAKMAGGEHESAATAVIDWGYDSATFVLARDGYPWFTRMLRCNGMQRVVACLADGIKLDVSNSQQLLGVYGVRASSGEKLNSELRLTVNQLVLPEIQHIADEIRKTLAYVAQEHPDQRPDRILLTGGGATIRNVADVLDDLVGLRVDVWQLNTVGAVGGVSDDAQSALFAPAMALSAIGVDG